MGERLYATDLEGPITKNDNAAELTAHVVPEGSELFKRVSLYDDYLAEVIVRPGYRAGDTLRLILPSLLAYGATAEGMRTFSKEGIRVVPGAGEVLRQLAGMGPAYIISTSYCQYVEAVCEVVGFPPGQVFCTRVDLDAHPISPEEADGVRALGERVLSRPPIELPPGAKGPEDLSPDDRETVADLDQIFWELLPKLQVYGIVEAVRTVGGPEKAESLRKAAVREGAPLSGIIYVGDSITDVRAFRLARSEGGVAVSFNGNRWAVQEADIAIISDRADPVVPIVEAFLGGGRSALEAMDWPRGGAGWEASWVADADLEAIVQRSEVTRKQVRGQVIGGLG
jgi:predicted HAD superfamily phosphohydrolase